VNVHINAACIDPVTGQQISGCTGDFYSGLIDCGNICCVPPQISYLAGACNANNEQPVTFTTVWNIPASLPSKCYPILGQLNFGNGNSVGLIQYMPGPGTYSFTDTYYYPAATSTTYQAQFVYTHPSCPPVPIAVTVGPCATAPCPPLPTPPPWCYCTLCYIFSQKHGKAWCKIILPIVALYVGAIIFGIFMGWISYNTSSFTNPNGSINWAMVVTWNNVITSLVLIGLIPAVVWYPHWCSDCCAACALLLGIILGIIAVIIALIFGYLPITVPSTTIPNTNVTNPSLIAGIIVLIVLFLTWLIFNASCKQYAAQHLTADTWCKD
jgi:hypothetical protein